MGLKEVIKLASNENPFGPSPKAVDAIKKNNEPIGTIKDAYEDMKIVFDIYDWSKKHG